MSTASSSSSSSLDETLTLTPNAETLIPGLPDDVSSIILSLIPFPHQIRLKLTSRSWRSFLSSNQPFHINRCLIHLNPHPNLLCIFPQDPSITPPYLFDPRHNAWRPLPSTPCSPHRYGLSNFIAVSLGHHLYVLGGAFFDPRSFPIGRPRPSASVFRLDLTAPSPVWDRVPSMRSPRGSFACAAVPASNSILVAGGGSRHTLFGASGTRMSSVERYDVGRDEWVMEEGLPRFRSGCVGFLVGGKEFWVMGGYGNCRMISGVFPVDEYYRDGVVLDLRSGKWREIGDMWVEGERWKLGTVVVVDGIGAEAPGIFMLDRDDIFRYDIACNCWRKESSLPRKTPADSSCGFVALDGELYVMFASSYIDSTDCRRRQLKRSTLFIQVYNPKKRVWRYQMKKPPFQLPLNFNTAVMCTIRL